LVVQTAVAFERTTLLVTNTFCRVTWTGITTMDFTSDYKLKRVRDFYDADALKEQLIDCELPLFDASEIKNPDPKSALKETYQ
jgi:hypothetical protein